MKLLMKGIVLLFWLLIIMLVGFVWLVIVLVQVCLRRAPARFPAAVSDTTRAVTRWLL